MVSVLSDILEAKIAGSDAITASRQPQLHPHLCRIICLYYRPGLDPYGEQHMLHVTMSLLVTIRKVMAAPVQVAGSQEKHLAREMTWLLGCLAQASWQSAPVMQLCNFAVLHLLPKLVRQSFGLGLEEAATQSLQSSCAPPALFDTPVSVLNLLVCANLSCHTPAILAATASTWIASA
ncbi:hypothetical protein WJX81_002325 [Elliptochloris bilobata]|uniref:Uncharacterized protein n=1 Tax=Elliptochloris bilobata TaxID=381761 RepID=A0AAW1SJC3_9CHLO